MMLVDVKLLSSPLSARDGGYAWAQHHGLLPIGASITAECSICQQRRWMLSSQYDAISWEDQSGGQCIALNLFHIQRSISSSPSLKRYKLQV